ncbi:hypothetical protein GCM10011386_36300 [Parapedobacter defluvii]|uniref:Secreted protein n=1 Tax=Parapedobacter defluvii TaxID=2045106 RepID=A0ABQ1MQ28_9SPHI|nr:hypothetical protein [Parapedobacter defluvii]GGC40992.1 hypothetical protein GCM10011386_36300 [Parapedobacter defluvii]
MKGFAKYIVAMLCLFRMLECRENERDQQRWERSSEHPTYPVKYGIADDSLPSDPRTESDVLPDDSLERTYDRNYMDYDPEHNMDKDDEWHDYFND